MTLIYNLDILPCIQGFLPSQVKHKPPSSTQQGLLVFTALWSRVGLAGCLSDLRDKWPSVVSDLAFP